MGAGREENGDAYAFLWWYLVSHLFFEVYYRLATSWMEDGLVEFRVTPPCLNFDLGAQQYVVTRCLG